MTGTPLQMGVAHSCGHRRVHDAGEGFLVRLIVPQSGVPQLYAGACLLREYVLDEVSELVDVPERACPAERAAQEGFPRGSLVRGAIFQACDPKPLLVGVHDRIHRLVHLVRVAHLPHAVPNLSPASKRRRP